MRPATAILIVGVAGACTSGPPVAPPQQAATTEVSAPSRWVRPPVPGPLETAPAPLVPSRRVVRLRNGLQVVVVERHGRPIVATRLVFGEGVATEAPKARGATFLAVALLGDRREEDQSGKRLVGEELLRKEIRMGGGRYEADVDHDAASIGIDGFAADVGRYLERLGDAVKRPRCGPEMFAARRTAMIHALEDIELSDDSTLYRVLGRAAFGIRHPYARAIYGTQASLRMLGHEQVIWRQRALLDPRKTTLVVVGDVDSDEVLATARRALGDWQARSTRQERISVRPPRTSRNPPVQFIAQPTAQLMTICATRPVPDPSVPDAPLDVLAAVVGRGLRGRLSDRLRGDAGMVYSASAFVLRRRHARAFLACTRTPAEETEETLRRILSVLEEAGSTPPTPAELMRAKALLASDVETERTDIRSILAAEVETLGLGGRPSPSQRLTAITSVSATDVRDVAKEVLDPKRIRLVLAGRSQPARAATARLRLGRFEPVSSVW